MNIPWRDPLLGIAFCMGLAAHGQFCLAEAVPIPDLALWEKYMVQFGEKHRDERRAGVDESFVWYYDGQRVFYQIADYTHDAKWNQYAENSKETYRNYVLTRGGKVPGWRVFPHGLYQDFKRNGDPKSKEAVLLLAKNSAFAHAGGGKEPGLSRETAYILMAYLVAEELGEPKHPKRDQAVEYALGHMDQWFVSKTAPDVKPFMVGLTCEALIQYHGKSKDPRVPPAIKAAVDWLWENAWVAKDASFWYHSKDPYHPKKEPMKGAPDLNLLIAPAYAWVYLQMRDTKYRDRGDQAFSGGVRKAYLAGGKQFSQTYRWSFDYVKWRREAEGRP